MVHLVILSCLVILIAGCGGSQKPKVFGSPIPKDAEFVRIPELLRNPQEYAGKDVFVEGCAINQCPTSGCWIEVVEMGGNPEEKITVHLRSPAFENRMDEIRGQLKGRCVRLKGYVSLRSERVELHASSLEIIK